MLTLLKKLVQNFLFDEMAAKRWIRGSLGAAATILSQVIVDPLWSTWTIKQWFVHSLPALVAFAAGSVTAGDKTPENVKALAAETKP